jgi:hypothetical protein
VHPDHGCGAPPATSADTVAKWNWMSGVSASGMRRPKSPPWLMPTARGPLRDTIQSSPMRTRPKSEASWSLVVIGFETL